MNYNSLLIIRHKIMYIQLIYNLNIIIQNIIISLLHLHPGLSTLLLILLFNQQIKLLMIHIMSFENLTLVP